MASPVAVPGGAAVIHNSFEAVTAHTAKCDLCNSRNDSGMSRCQFCGWQSCHACTIKDGCTRTHNAGSRVHTGPIDRGQLASLSQSRARPTRVSKRGRRREQAQPSRPRPKMRARRGASRNANSPSVSQADTVTPPPPSFDAPQHSPSPLDDDPSSTMEREVVESEKYFQGVRDLYAFSLEAYGVWVNEQRECNPSQCWCYQAVRLEQLHEHSQVIATRAAEEFRRQAEGSRVW